MSKKGGAIIKIVAVVAGIAAVGTACYVYKDKIKEFFEKIQLKEKFEAAKASITEKLQTNKGDDFFDDAEFFDDEDVTDVADSGNRGYTPINITTDETEATEDSTASTTAVNEQAAAKDEATASNANEEADSFEYEGLSDTSEDEDVLAEEAAIDGNA